MDNTICALLGNHAYVKTSCYVCILKIEYRYGMDTDVVAFRVVVSCLDADTSVTKMSICGLDMDTAGSKNCVSADPLITRVRHELPTTNIRNM